MLIAAERDAVDFEAILIEYLMCLVLTTLPVEEDFFTNALHISRAEPTDAYFTQEVRAQKKDYTSIIAYDTNVILFP